jgi:proton-dependent oligopeptide transporter, POT family
MKRNASKKILYLSYINQLLQNLKRLFMFKGHPKGLLIAFLTNMGERFGFYTMMAILVLFLQARYGLSEQQAGDIYSWFYFGIYALALIGGIIADATRKYKTVILFGLIIMFAGYAVIAMPGLPLTVTIIGLFTIAFGNGMFKGNLQAVVGQLYDNPQFSKVRDSAFMIFYMGINIGAFFAPFVATGVRNWFLRTQGFLHDGSLPASCHAFLNGTLENTEGFRALANSVSGHEVTDLNVFAHQYLDAFSKGYNYAFGIAAGTMIVSLVVYLIFNKLLPAVQKVDTSDKKKKGDRKNSTASPVAISLAIGLMLTTSFIFHFLFNDVKLGLAVGLFIGFIAWIFQISTKEERPRVVSLLMVFFVVIFFWMSFHQNGLTLTFFARDYIVKTVGSFTNVFFNLESILAFIASVAGLVLIFARKEIKARIIGLAMFSIFGGLTYYFISGYSSQNPIAPEVFQSFNPLFIVALTFPVMGLFGWLSKKNIEPSTPKKIGIGMLIAALGFVLVLIASLNVVSPHELQFVDESGATRFNPVPDSSRVTPYWLVSSYLILTIAELFLSPMGLSFVSKVAPSRFQGLMQGGWLLATAVGNKFLFVGSKFWGKLDLWQLWLIFIVCCVLSALFIFSILKRLEKATS